MENWRKLAALTDEEIQLLTGQSKKQEQNQQNASYANIELVPISKSRTEIHKRKKKEVRSPEKVK